MIDYEKLKYCVDLAKESSEHFFTIKFCNYTFNDDISITLYNRNDVIGEWRSDNLNDLIMALEQLTKPEPKFKIGQQVWLLEANEIKTFKIDEIINDKGIWYLAYIRDGGFMDGELSFNQYREDLLYPTKEALIEAQVDYWYDLWEKNNPIISGDAISKKYRISSNPDAQNCLHDEQITLTNDNGDSYLACSYCKKVILKNCKHESDNLLQKDLSESKILGYKCIKCEEFYR